MIKSKAKKAILQVDKKLVQLLKECNFDNYIFSNDEKLPEFDIHCPLLSLPLKFSTTLQSIPLKNKYLFPNKDRIYKWKKTFDNRYLNIGINWQASPNPDLDKGRSFKLKYFNEISICDPFIYFYCTISSFFLTIYRSIGINYTMLQKICN